MRLKHLIGLIPVLGLVWAVVWIVSLLQTVAAKMPQ
jgi:hypothetical protein